MLEVGILGDVVLLDNGKELEMKVLGVILMEPTDEDDMIVRMLLELVFCRIGPEEPLGVAVIADSEEDEIVELGALSEPTGVRMAVVEVMTTGDVLINELVELIVEFDPNRGKVDWVLIIAVEPLTDTGNPDVSLGGLSVKVGADVTEMRAEQVLIEDAGADGEV